MSRSLPKAPPLDVRLQRGTESVLLHITDENASRWINLDEDTALKVSIAIKVILGMPPGSKFLDLGLFP